MRRTLTPVALAVVFAALAGCKKSDSAAGPAPSSAPISYEVRGEGGAVQKGAADSGVFTAGKNTLAFRSSALIVNGKQRGTVKPGDSVLLDEDGQLFVNGEKRAGE